MSQFLVSDEDLSKLETFFGKTVPHGLSYGTVRDYCEGFDTLQQLATYSNDLKDLQRFWMLKTILSTQPKGATLIEIGAGEPAVADLLGRLGYRVIVVDPYEGAGNGPQEVEYFKTIYRNVEYVISLFSADIPGIEPGSVDCVYSISVIEHIPRVAIDSVVAGIKLFTKPDGLSIHAIDFVSAGRGSEYHQDMLKYFAEALGLSTSEVDENIAASALDADTYFLSAEAHNRWRGTMSYDDFPMRKVISAHIVAAQ